MKVVIAGSRGIDDMKILELAIEKSGFPVTSVISGHCKTSVDALGEKWAKHHGLPIYRMPAKWQEQGKAAGPLRNKEMAKVCDAAVIIWDGESKGTSNMIGEIIALGKPLYVVTTKPVSVEPAQDPFDTLIDGE